MERGRGRIRQWFEVLAGIGSYAANLLAPKQENTAMPNPNDPQLQEQKKALSSQIDTLRRQLETDPNNESLKANLADLERQEKSLNDQLKTSRDTAKQDQPRGKSEEARASAPGQQKKN